MSDEVMRGLSAAEWDAVRRSGATEFYLTKFGHEWAPLPDIADGRCGCCGGDSAQGLCTCRDVPLEYPPEHFPDGVEADDGTPLCPHGHEIMERGHDPFRLILERRAATRREP